KYLFYLAVCLLFLAVFGHSSIAKLCEREVPAWFISQFEGTWLARFSSRLQYRFIMLLELAVALLFLASLAFAEAFGNDPKVFMGYGLLLASAVFTMLCFGQRVSADFVGAASSYVYAAGALILWFLVTNGGR